MLTHSTSPSLVPCLSAGSGTIDASELGGVLKAMGYKVSPAEQEALLQLMDTDHNGQIDFDEFSAAFVQMAEVCMACRQHWQTCAHTFLALQ